MQLVWFLTIATILSITLGEFGQFPFGASLSISLTDLLLALTLGLLLVWQVGIKHSKAFPKVFFWMVIFWGWATVTLLLSQDLSGGLYLARFILYSSCFYLGWLLIKSKAIKENQLIGWITITSLVLAVAGFVQLMLFPDLARLTDLGFDPHQGRLVSTFLDPNLVGTFLNLGLGLAFLCFINSHDRRSLIVAAVILLAIILTLSRSAYLMLVTTTLILGFWRWRKLLIGLVVLLLMLNLLPQVNQRLVGAVQFDATVKERVESWQKGLTVFRSQPITGVGFNNLRAAYERANLIKVFSTDGGHAGAGNDSSLIFILATTGLPGLAILVVFWAIVVYQLWQHHSGRTMVLLSILAGLLVNSQFINSLFYPPVMLTIYLLAGAILADML